MSKVIGVGHKKPAEAGSKAKLTESNVQLYQYKSLIL